MLRFGEPPYLECSSRGDKRFSAFCAIIKSKNNTIENLYQEFKMFEDGTTGLNWRQAKGKLPVNIKECRKYYSQLWDEYIKENPELLKVLQAASGLSDIFGIEGHACQAEELWRIREQFGSCCDCNCICDDNDLVGNQTELGFPKYWCTDCFNKAWDNYVAKEGSSKH